jgi:hypothetical protein
MTDQEFRCDAFDCRRDTTLMHPGAAGFIGSWVIQKTFQECMESRGYSKVE